jgi:hypothetical protein
MRAYVLMLVSGLMAFAQVDAARADVVPFPEAPPSGGATFSNNSSRVRALLVHGDTIYAGGRFTVSQGGVTRSNLAAFDFNGNLRATFAAAPNGPVWALATDGVSLFVGGDFTRLELESRLAAVDLTTGAVKRDFSAHINGLINAEVATGVHALSVLTDESSQPPTLRLLVGGNFTQVNATTDNRVGLAALSTDRGALDSARFTQGVEGGYVRALVTSGGAVYVGGEFTAIQGRSASLAALDARGVLQRGSFSTSSEPVLDLSLDAVQGRLFAAVGGLGNRVRAYTATGRNRGSSLWQGPRSGGVTNPVRGDVQAVHYFEGNVYFGFHDGMFTEPDAYKMGALSADTGDLEVDGDHADLPCSNATPEELVNCWLPELDATTGGQGFFGVWTIADFLDPATNERGLIVGGDFTQIGGVTRTRRMAIFRAP